MYRLTDSITRIRNAGSAGNEFVEILSNRFIVKIVELLKKNGFVGEIEELNDLKNTVKIKVAYSSKGPIFDSVKFISTPKRRVYYSVADIEKHVRKFNFLVVSTNKGVMSGKEALESGLGGEAMFVVRSF